MSNEVNGGLDHPGEIGCFAMTMHMHVEDPRIFKEEMVMQCGDFKTVVEKCAHDGVHLVFEKHEIAHHYLVPARSLRHCQPTAETERCGCGDAVYSHLQ